LGKDGGEYKLENPDTPVFSAAGALTMVQRGFLNGGETLA
jgi:hypothetical protein